MELLSLRNKSPGSGECGCHLLHLFTNKPRCLTWLSRRCARSSPAFLSSAAKKKQNQTKKIIKYQWIRRGGETTSCSSLINGHKRERCRLQTRPVENDTGKLGKFLFSFNIKAPGAAGRHQSGRQHSKTKPFPCFFFFIILFSLHGA